MTCRCGCGQITNVSKRGRHSSFIVGHNRRKSAVRYIVLPNGCWEWQGALAPNGYGHIRRDGQLLTAHRVYWIEANGPVAEGLDIDHLCRNRRCVNPEHLEPVTRSENMLRAHTHKRSLTHA